MSVRNRVIIVALGIVLASQGTAQNPVVSLLVPSSLGQAPAIKQTTPPPAAAALRTLKPEDYKQWERLVRPRITEDGHWIAYELNRVDADPSVVIRNADGPERVEIPNASRVVFSEDSKFVAYLISPPKVEMERMAEERRPAPTRLGVRNLTTGGEVIYDDIRSFAFRKGTHQVIAIRAKTDKPPTGSDLLVFDAAGGEPIVVPQTSSYALNKAQNFLIADISSGSGYSAVQLVDLNSGSIVTIQHAIDEILGLTWAEKANVFAYAVAKPNKAKEGNNHLIFRVELTTDRGIVKTVLDPEGLKEFPAGQRISELAGIGISPDGSAISFGLQPWKDKKKPVNPKDVPGVEVWNTKDAKLMPLQKRQVGADSARSNLYIWRPKTMKFQKAAPFDQPPSSKEDFNIEPLGDSFDKVLIVKGDAYESASTNGFGYEDAYVYDIESNQLKTVFKKNHFGARPSSTGRFISYYDDKSWWMYDTKMETSARMGSKGTNFENVQDDHTVEAKPPAAGPVWLDKDEAVIVQDEFDAWLADPATGKIHKLTDGRKEQIEFRYRDVNPDDELPKVSDPMYFSMFDAVSKRAGFFLTDGKDQQKVLFSADSQVNALLNCKSADRMMFQMANFDKSPNLYVTNRAFTAAKPVTKTNPQQAQFKWGKSELIQYKSRFGVPLQGTLIYPADYSPDKNYPMVTYIYERLSDNLHNYVVPVEWDAYNAQVLSQSGYFVFQPDIAYKGDTPGQNAVDCLEPAVDAVLKKNVGVDAKHVGLIGHSWGAYQTAFVTTVSDRFAVGACGAPLTELTSMYNSFYWNSGGTDQTIFESSQGRMRVPFWESPKTYFDNSPVWQTSKRKVPILFAFGDADGAVDWHQGQYLYNTLRRQGKAGVLLVYAGENHGLAKRPNQLDYARRLRHFLDVYLKGEKPETWVTDGVPLLQQLDK